MQWLSSVFLLTGKAGSIGGFWFFPLIGTVNNFKDTAAFFNGRMLLPLALSTVWLVWRASPYFWLMSSSIAANFNFHAKVYAKDKRE